MTIQVRDALERELLEQVSRERLHEYVSIVAREERMSGSPEERRAMEYIARTLRSWDVAVDEHEHEGWVSRPLRARLEIREPEPGRIECITHSFAATGQWSGELVYAGPGDDAAYASLDVLGKAVLVEGLASPGKVVTAQRHGATAAIFITDRNLHQMIVTPVWGTPTPDTIDKVPRILAVSVRLADGERLRTWAGQGRVCVALEAEVETAWVRLPVVVGTVRGARDPDHFVMLGGHIDSWFFGAIDNGAANATALEVMRLLAPILSFDYAATADELLGALRRYQEQGGHAVDLGAVIARAEALRAQLEALARRLDAIEPEGPRAAAANQALIDLGRILVPLDYTEAGPFEHDLALHVPALPALHGMHRLARLDPASDAHRFLATQLLRRRNLVSMTLRRAQERVTQALAALR